MDDRSEGTDQLIALIYEKTLSQSPWAEIGDAIAGAIGLHAPMIIHQPKAGAVSRFLTKEIAPTATPYDTHFRELDFILQHVKAHERHQAEFQATDILTAAELAHNEFWMDFVRPLHSSDIYYTVLKPTEADKFYLSFHAAEDRKPEPKRQNALRKTLIMHLSNALALSLRTRGRGSGFTSLSYLFEDLDCAAAVLKPDGSVIEINDAMRHVLGDGLIMDGRRLRSEFSAEQYLIDELVGTHILLPPHRLREHITLASSSGRLLHLRTIRAPLRTLFGPDTGFRDGVTLLLVTTARFPRLNAERILMSSGLTAGEAAVANLVGSGFSPEEAAVEIGLKLSTARQYLKQVYDKLGINRQSELTRMVLRFNIGAE